MNLCTCVSEEGVDGEVVHSETSSLLSYTLRYVSFTEVVNVCRVPFREPIHLSTCVNEEGGFVCCLLLIDKAKGKDKTYI